MWQDTDASEALGTSNFRAEVKFSETSVSYHITGRGYNPEDYDLNRYRCEVLRSPQEVSSKCFCR